jgi:hypothetical protein
MKFSRNNLLLFALSLLLFILAFFLRCNNDVKKNDDVKTDSCCQGFTGTVTDSAANVLKNTCHFMIKDSIEAWTARYQNNKTQIANNQIGGIPNVLNDSSSFNRCIIKAIICNDSCIGLRVVMGMDINKKVHVILVGVKPDYTTLYIRRPAECCPSSTKSKGAPDDPSGDWGGAEYGQIP